MDLLSLQAAPHPARPVCSVRSTVCSGEADAGASLDAPQAQQPGGSVSERAMRLTGGSVVHVLYGVNVATSYMLMLAAMTFNVGIFASTCTGARGPCCVHSASPIP